jgi:hypothetical protein
MQDPRPLRRGAPVKGLAKDSTRPFRSPGESSTMEAFPTPWSGKGRGTNDFVNLGGTPRGTNGVEHPQPTPFASLRDVPPSPQSRPVVHLQP